MKTKWQTVKDGWKWFLQTSTIVGMPVLMIVVLVGVQKIVFTSTCQIAGWRCEHAFGATDAMVEYMGELIASNPGNDITVKRQQR